MKTERNSEGVPPASYQFATEVALRVLLTADKREIEDFTKLPPATSFIRKTLYAFVPKRIKIIMQRRQDMKPLTGWPKDVFPVLVQLVDSIANDRAVKEFYIGRGADPSERRSYHGSDDIVAIYFTDSVDNAIVVESALIKTFYNHPK